MRQFKAYYYLAESKKQYSFLFPDDAEVGSIYYDRAKDSYVQICDSDQEKHNFQLRVIDERVLNSKGFTKVVRYGKDTKEHFYNIRKGLEDIEKLGGE